MDQVGISEHKFRPVEYLVDRELDYHDYSELQLYQVITLQVPHRISIPMVIGKILQCTRLHNLLFKVITNKTFQALNNK